MLLNCSQAYHQFCPECPVELPAPTTEPGISPSLYTSSNLTFSRLTIINHFLICFLLQLSLMRGWFRARRGGQYSALHFGWRGGSKR